MASELKGRLLAVSAGFTHKFDTTTPLGLCVLWSISHRCANSAPNGRRLEYFTWRLWQREQLVDNKERLDTSTNTNPSPRLDSTSKCGTRVLHISPDGLAKMADSIIKDTTLLCAPTATSSVTAPKNETAIITQFPPSAERTTNLGIEPKLDPETCALMSSKASVRDSGCAIESDTDDDVDKNDSSDQSNQPFHSASTSTSGAALRASPNESDKGLKRSPFSGLETIMEEPHDPVSNSSNLPIRTISAVKQPLRREPRAHHVFVRHPLWQRQQETSTANLHLSAAIAFTTSSIEAVP